MLRIPVLRFLVSMWCSVILLEGSVVSKFTVSVSWSYRQYFLDNDRECLFQLEQGAQRCLSVRLDIPSLFLQTFLAVFFTSPICFLPINGPYTIIFTVIDTVKIKHLFHRKKGFSLYLLSRTFFSFN